ncbi:MAG: hypothetical protein M2R45_04382 [Verrucomicrobia subdivision 3 bacterium]|nr:hypothetical protein [Limisphaerales bacterium]MCS1417279.1 hypothetical protein [Limisphaerales bacterium]
MYLTKATEMTDATGLHHGDATERGRSDERRSRSPQSEAKNCFPTAGSDRDRGGAGRSLDRALLHHPGHRDGDNRGRPGALGWGAPRIR